MFNYRRLWIVVIQIVLHFVEYIELVEYIAT